MKHGGGRKANQGLVVKQLVYVGRSLAFTLKVMGSHSKSLKEGGDGIRDIQRSCLIQYRREHIGRKGVHTETFVIRTAIGWWPELRNTGNTENGRNVRSPKRPLQD